MNCDPNAPVTQSELNQLERYLDGVWGALGVDIEFTRHFFDRVNDPRNKKQITVCELQKIFTDAMKHHGQTIISQVSKKKDLKGVIKSYSTNINTPFILSWDDRSNEFELVTPTIMRKKNFKVPGGQKQFKVEGMGPFEAMVEQAYTRL